MRALLALGAGAGAVLVIEAFLGSAVRFRPILWVWRQLVTKPVSTWFRAETVEAVKPKLDDLHDEIVAVNAAVNHVEPGAPRLIERLSAVERKVDETHRLLAGLTNATTDSAAQVDKLVKRSEPPEVSG